MAHSSSDKIILLKVAKDSLLHGLSHGCPLLPDFSKYSLPLQQVQASFVTLMQNQKLRGCIGTIEPTHPLVVDVAYNAYAAGFQDPRFPKLRTSEIPEISISILSRCEPIPFTSEEDLLHKIRPGIDGLVLKDGNCRGTFLPAVWEDCPVPEDFLKHLKLKAGLSMDYWSTTLKVDRFTTESIP